MTRYEIIDELKDLGCNYNFERFNTAQLYKILEKEQEEHEYAEVQKELCNKSNPQTCDNCGAYLDTVGECPVCDHGEEDYFENLNKEFIMRRDYKFNESLIDDVDDVEVAIREYFEEYGSGVDEEDIFDLSRDVFDFFEKTDSEKVYDEVEELVDTFIEEEANNTTIRLIRKIRGY